MLKVRCYWNLHRNLWSVQDAKTRRVIGHAKKVLLREVVFTVSEKGRLRVLREKRKNVHAFAVGELHGAAWETPFGFGPAYWTRGDAAYAAAAARLGETVTYNPYKDATFVRFERDERVPVVGAQPMALLTATGSGKSRKAALLSFNPLRMTEDESRRATV